MMVEQYEVLDISERTRLGDTNRVETYYVLRCKSAQGTVFTVRLTEEEIDPAKAKLIIAAKAQQLDKLKGR